MTYRGRVKDGVVVVEGPDKPPEGAEMSMRLVKPRSKSIRKSKKKDDGLSFYDRIKDLIGTVDLPADFSANHDHYLYGCPKRKATRRGK